MEAEAVLNSGQDVQFQWESSTCVHVKNHFPFLPQLDKVSLEFGGVADMSDCDESYVWLTYWTSPRISLLASNWESDANG